MGRGVNLPPTYPLDSLKGVLGGKLEKKSKGGNFQQWDVPFFRDFSSSLSKGVKPPSTRHLELKTTWDKGGILRPVQS